MSPERVQPRKVVSDPVLIDPARPMLDEHTRVQRLRALAHLLDTAFVLPGTSIRFGVDALLGLIPVVGDAVAAALSAFIIREARELGVPRTTLLRMAWNVGVDLCAGAVPLVGDVFDVAWKANKKNLALVLAHLERKHKGRQEATRD
jgi:hypothetical protein